MRKQSLKGTHYRACNLCEAICGLEIEFENDQIISIKGDKNDPHSKGHICPKATALEDIHNDPDRIRFPIKNIDGNWIQISWKQAVDEVSVELKKIQCQYGVDAVAVYMGNPTVHSLDAMLFSPHFVRSLKTKNRFSATSVDQLPEQLVSQLMFGHSLLIPLPDLDHTDFLIIFGANPVVSNGSLMTAPGVSRRLKGIQKRGGRIVVVDPRKTETASLADEHLFITPGRDALMLLAMLHVVFVENLHSLGRVAAFSNGLETIEETVKAYSPERVACMTGVDPSQIRQLVHSFCHAKSATCYGRIGVSTQEFGTLTQWLIVVFNTVTGNLDLPGGAMFSKPAIDILRRSTKKRPKKHFGEQLSRVRKLPRFNGEFPVVTLADEITTEGKGQVRALVTNAGNPVLSTPDSNRLDKALGKLDFMVSFDFYVNETTRHANFILPPPSALERSHYDIAFHSLAIHNTARFSTPLFMPGSNSKSEARVFLELSWRMQAKSWFSKVNGWIRKEILIRLGSAWIVNRLLKSGPYAKSHKLNLKKLKRNPHGLDLGPMQPCLPNRLFTMDKCINLAPEQCISDIQRLEGKVFHEPEEQRENESEFDLLLIGRRSLRSNNSWLHNSQRLVKGKNRCVALIHPTDARSRNISDGNEVFVRSSVGEIRILVTITEEIMPGVISIPHGWGHQMPGVKLHIAKLHSGVNTNILTDHLFIDELSGNAALNGVPVSVSKMQLP